MIKHCSQVQPLRFTRASIRTSNRVPFGGPVKSLPSVACCFPVPSSSLHHHCSSTTNTTAVVGDRAVLRYFSTFTSNWSPTAATASSKTASAAVLRSYAIAYMKKNEIDKCLGTLASLYTKFNSAETSKHVHQLLITLSKYAKLTIDEARAIVEFAERRGLLDEHLARNFLLFICQYQQKKQLETGQDWLDETVLHIWTMVIPVLIKNWNVLRLEELLEALKENHQVEPHIVIVNILLLRVRDKERMKQFVDHVESGYKIQADQTTHRRLTSAQ